MSSPPPQPAPPSAGDTDVPDDPTYPPDFYTKAASYWNSVTPTVTGMLGGLSYADEPDIAGSADILRRFGPSRKERALDCGAGIGRVTKNLLLPRFQTVDMVEVTAKFLEASKEYIGEPDCSRVGERFCTSLHVSPRHWDASWLYCILFYNGSLPAEL